MRPRFWQWPQWDKESFYFIGNKGLGEMTYLRTRFYYDKFSNLIKAYDDASYSTQTRLPPHIACSALSLCSRISAMKPGVFIRTMPGHSDALASSPQWALAALHRCFDKQSYKRASTISSTGYFLVDGYPEAGRTAYINFRYRF